jgi:hypothetical protein
MGPILSLLPFLTVLPGVRCHIWDHKSPVSKDPAWQSCHIEPGQRANQYILDLNLCVVRFKLDPNPYTILARLQNSRPLLCNSC